MGNLLISNRVNKLLGDTISLPIPIEKIVLEHGVRLLPYDLGDNVSGILVTENGQATIGYTKNEQRVRNRFTIAHELVIIPVMLTHYSCMLTHLGSGQ